MCLVGNNKLYNFSTLDLSSHIYYYFIVIILIDILYYKVGNLPYDINEEEVVRIFSEVGPVKDFRMNFDKQSGKPKGYGFCEFYG